MTTLEQAKRAVMVPIPIFVEVEGDKYAHSTEGAGIEAKRVLVEAPAGTEIELTKVSVIASSGQLLLAEVKQGDRFIWPQGMMDVLFLNELPLEGIVIRDDEPLELYLRTVYTTPPGGGETFNAVFMGKQTIIDEDRYRENRAKQAKASGFVHINDLKKWLPQTVQGQLIGSVVAQYMDGKTPDLTVVEVGECSIQQQSTMPSTEWIKLLRKHLQRSDVSFAKRVLLSARARLRRDGRDFPVTGPQGETL